MEREQFQLKKVTLLNGGGLQVAFTITIVDDNGDVSSYSDNRKSANIRRHPLIDHHASKLKRHILHGAGHLSAIESFEKSITQKPQRDKFKSAKDRMIAAEEDKLTVTSVSFSGEDHLFGVKASGTYKSFQGQGVSLTTPRIVFSQDAIGIENEVEAICDDLADECFDYLFEGKKWQAELDFTPEQKESPTAKKKPQLAKA